MEGGEGQVFVDKGSWGVGRVTADLEKQKVILITQTSFVLFQKNYFLFKLKKEICVQLFPVKMVFVETRIFFFKKDIIFLCFKLLIWGSKDSSIEIYSSVSKQEYLKHLRSCITNDIYK